MRCNGFSGALTLAASVMTVAIVMASACVSQASVVTVTGVTGHDGGNWPSYYGHLSDMLNGLDATIIDTGTGADLTTPGMDTSADPTDPSTWTYSGGSWHQEWKANSRLSSATNGKIGWAALDLGSSVADLENMYLWNVRSQNNTENVATYNVYYADSPTTTLPAMPNSKAITGDYDFSSGGWTLLNSTGALSLAQNGSNDNTPQGVVPMGGISAQYIGIEILTAGGAASRVGLAQVELTASDGGPAPQLVGELGVLDPATANGGINPATGNPWQEGDQYRLTFHTSTTRDATSTNINDYNTFVNSVADGSVAFPKLGDGDKWKVVGSTETVSARDNTGTDTNSDMGIFALDGVTMIAEDSDDMWNGFGVRIPATGVYFSPGYLNEEGGGDSGTNHGVNCATGSNSNGTIRTPLGGTTRVNWGSSNPNNGGRWAVRWDRGDPTAQWRFYAMSDPLTVTAGAGVAAVPEPSTFVLAALGLLWLGWYGWRRRSK